MSRPSPLGAIPASLAVSVTHTEGAAVVTFRGDLDLATQEQLRRTLADMVRLEPALLVVDLSQVGSFDCGAIGEFVRARSALRDLGSTLVLRAPSASGFRTLEIVGLLDLVSLASLRGVASPPAPQEQLSTATEVAVLTSAWRTASEERPTTGQPLVFKEPEMIVRAILRALDPGSEPDSTAPVGPGLAGSLSHDVSFSRIAVRQLLELRRVVQAWIGWSVFPPRQRELQRRLTEVLDGSVLEVVSTALAELERAALVDPLTGLMNRRALDRDLTQFLAAARRHDRSLTVVMLDVVGLKSTNDRFGHEAGDELLKDVASGLIGRLRVGDNLYRIGGDEFVLLLPDLRPEDVDVVMDRAVMGPASAFTWGSAGVPTDLGHDVGTPAALLALADRRMIQHRSGRGRGLAPVDAAPRMNAGARLAGDSPRLVEQLAAAGRSHSVIEQAKGIVAEHFGIDMEQAAAVLGEYSAGRTHSMRRTAYALVGRTISVSELSPPKPLSSPSADDAMRVERRIARAGRS
ncbi:MAG: diguanylate cyclase [Actinomycetota bacterium]|nr:diguanylate cyclase [Actinomycetota bacterium]